MTISKLIAIAVDVDVFPQPYLPTGTTPPFLRYTAYAAQHTGMDDGSIPLA
jgi:hypothetical protein